MKQTINAFCPGTNTERHSQWDGTDTLKAVEKCKPYSHPQQQGDLRLIWLAFILGFQHVALPLQSLRVSNK